MTGDVVVDSLHGIKDPLVVFILSCLITAIGALFFWVKSLVKKDSGDQKKQLNEVDQKVDKLGNTVEDIKKEQVNMNKQFKDSRNELVQAFKESIEIAIKGMERSEHRQEQNLKHITTIVEKTTELVNKTAETAAKNEGKIEIMMQQNEELTKMMREKGIDRRKPITKPGGE